MSQDQIFQCFLSARMMLLSVVPALLVSLALMRKPERLSSQCSDPAEESSGVLSETTDDPQEQNTVSSAVSRTYDQNLNLNWTLVSQRRRRKSDRLCSGSGPEQNMNTEL